MIASKLRFALIAGSFAVAGLAGMAGAPAARAAEDGALKSAVASPARTPAFAARDKWRKPVEVLTFFGIRPDMTVVEIWPGRRGWWTEILAPYLKDRGVYRVVQNTNPKKKSREPSPFPSVISDFSDDVDLAPPGSADMILTFRNLHNWMKRGTADNAFKAFYKALKPGGVLGITDHRGRTDKPQNPEANDGYVREDYAIMLAEKAGFKFAGRSDVKSNPRDTKDHPKGVWTLPPNYRLGDQDRARYETIGESDRFVLKFVKPAN